MFDEISDMCDEISTNWNTLMKEVNNHMKQYITDLDDIRSGKTNE